MNNTKEILFVYNAYSGKLNGYMETLHKKISPETYPCSLCAITYGLDGELKDWAEFRSSIPIKMKFLHIDEWSRGEEYKSQLPAAFIQEGDSIRTFISKEKMDSFTLEELKSFIKANS